MATRPARHMAEPASRAGRHRHRPRRLAIGGVVAAGLALPGAVALSGTTPPAGAARNGVAAVAAFGSARVHGAPAPGTLAAPVVAMAPTPHGNGYWLAERNGAVEAFGDARHYGPKPGDRPAHPVVAIAATPDGKGYWLAERNGAVEAFGDARHYGGLAGRHLRKPVVAIAATPDGKGYWLAAEDGGVFAFGDARFHGSLGATTVASPIVAMAPTPDGNGYWLAGANGAVHGFGDARFHRSLPSKDLASPVVAIAPTASGRGYFLAAAHGGVFAFGDARFHGSLGGHRLPEPVVAMATVAGGTGYLLATTVARPPQCTAAQLTTTVGRGQGALGHEELPLRFDDTSPSPCTLHGYPGVAGLGPSGRAVTNAVRTPRGYMGGLPPGAKPPYVPLVTGETAAARVEGTDVPVGNKPSCPRLHGIAVTPPNTRTTTRFATSPPDCSRLMVHPVVPNRSGSEIGG